MNKWKTGGVSIARIEKQCIICHEPILIDEALLNEPICTEHETGCQNQHIAHTECLKNWVLNSDDCPICGDKYPPTILDTFADFKEEARQKAEAERQKAEKERQKAESKKNAWPPELEAGFEKVLDLEDKGEFMTAIEKCWDLHDELAPNPKSTGHTDILLELGRCYICANKFPLAMKQLLKLVKIDFKFPLGFYYLGIAYQEMQILDKALWAFKRSLKNLEALVETDPNYAEILNDVQTRIEALSE